MSKIEQAFSHSGVLAQVIEGYTPREPQIEMAIEVAEAIEQQSVLIAEAGTGTGKTFAYLLPALMSDRQVIVSTGTKNLQEQLFYKDLPLIVKALKTKAQVALLKGRANYLCLQRLDLYQQTRGQLDAQSLADFVSVRQWASSTITGDIGELIDVAEDSPVFPFVTSTVDNCLAKDCPHIDDCYLVKARQKAIEADLVVVNHHLFFADMALKDTGFGELIPQSEVVIFDEAHQIPDIASEYFGDAFSTRQVADLCRDVEQLYHSQFKDVKQLGKAAEKLAKSALEFRLLFPHDPERGNWREKTHYAHMMKRFDELHENLDFLMQVIKLCLGRSDEIDSCYDRVTLLLSKHQLMANTDLFGISFWYETTNKHVVLHQTPLTIADKFNDYIENSHAGWVFTSATLAVDGGFEHFAHQLGLKSPSDLLVESPFDYLSQSQLLLPRYLPAANHPNRAQALTDIAIPLIEASKGHCFMLFTSYRMMNLVAELLAEKIDNPLLIQGTMSKRKLLDAFIEQADAVLLATASFWEGVDVRGDKLTCVIIDKLPFASPDDPLLQARSEDVKRQNGDPFAQIQLPQAVITLKQGVGRLIRDVADRGVLTICDDRLVNREYGQVFLKSLPPMRRTRDINNAVALLNEIHS